MARKIDLTYAGTNKSKTRSSPLCIRIVLKGVMHKKTIIILDDEQEITFGLELFFSNDFNVYTFNEHQKCLAFLMKQELKPDLFLFDILLGNANGIDLSQKIKQMPFYRDIPFFFMSYRMLKYRKMASPGMFIAKPFNLKILKECLMDHLI